MELLDTSLAAWRAQLLHVGVRIGLFAEIGDGERNLPELCRALGCPARSLERLLIAAEACKLLEREDGRYRNAASIRSVLVPGRPGYLGHWIRLMGHWFRAFGDLEEAVRSGRNVQRPELHLGEDPDYTRDFVEGMEDYASYRGADVLHHLDLAGCRRLLDLGGGPGTYAIHFARHHPELHCTVLDLPVVTAIARERIRQAGLGDRVQTRDGDYHADELGSGYDVVFVSDVLHQEGEKDAEAIVRRAHGALEPGGRIVVQGMFLRDDHSGPEWPALFNLLMLLLYPEGQAYSAAETRAWLERAGFEDIALVPMSVFNANSLLVGSKPAS